MCDEPMLDVHGAFGEFPQECKAVLDHHWQVERDIEFWINKAECERGSFLDLLTRITLLWLAGKEPVECFVRCGFLYFGHRWPDDPLRALLEEVRAQLEKDHDA